ncbi:PP2C family protein-serine/threonine phosphatase [Kineococcus sp. LSe6-4]|uniref:PP2C family protein-serine/threonine phosphatase n=1 Tax=Kineococcus halophytocola TaxID=3234027 RepID=A0ABV4H4W8_9ACTN
MGQLRGVGSAWRRLWTRTTLQRRVSVMGISFLAIVLVLTVVLIASRPWSTSSPATQRPERTGSQLTEQIDEFGRAVVQAQSTHQLYVTASTVERLQREQRARAAAMERYEQVRRPLVTAVGRPGLDEEVRQRLTRVLDDAAYWRSVTDRQADFKADLDQVGLSDSILDDPSAQAFLAVYLDLGPLNERLREIDDRTRGALVDQRDRFRYVQLVVAGIALLLVPAVLHLVRRWVLRPLGSLSEQLLRVGGGDLQTPVSLPGPPELAAVAASAETMRRRILDELADAVSAREALKQGQPLVAEVRDQLTAHDLPVVPGWSSAAALRPAEGLLAGDWYDVLPLADGRFAVVVADVSGHGARAGIVAIQLKRLLEAALNLAPEPDLALAMAARVFADEAERFASCVVVVVDPDSGTVSYANAGHPAPVVLRAGEEDGSVRVVGELEATGPLLSWLHLDVPGSWHTATTSLAPGSVLVVYTDGLTEARPTGSTDELGIEGVLQALGGLPELTPQALVDEALDVARRFSGGRARDDVTLVALSRGTATVPSAPVAADGAQDPGA